MKGYQAIRKPIKRLLLITNSIRVLINALDSLIVLLIRHVFEDDYSIRNILRFSPFDKIYQYQYVAFTDTKRRVFYIGDFYYIQPNYTLYQIDQITIIRFQGNRYVFFIAIELELIDLHDTILNILIYQITESVAIFSLPRLISSVRDYILDTLVDSPQNDVDREAREVFIKYPYRLEYLQYESSHMLTLELLSSVVSRGLNIRFAYIIA